jgi:hypothetical protein
VWLREKNNEERSDSWIDPIQTQWRDRAGFSPASFFVTWIKHCNVLLIHRGPTRCRFAVSFSGSARTGGAIGIDYCQDREAMALGEDEALDRKHRDTGAEGGALLRCTGCP